MKTILKAFTCKNLSDLTDIDWMKLKNYHSKFGYESNLIFKDIHANIEHNCHNELRIKGCKFECDNILTDIDKELNYICNLKYIGDTFDDAEISDRLSIGVYNYNIDKYSKYSRTIDDMIDFKIYLTEAGCHSNKYDSFNLREFETQHDIIINTYELTESEYDNILAYIRRVSYIVQVDYNLFKKEIKKICESYYKIYQKYSNDFSNYIIGKYPNFAILFDEDGEIYKYYLNYIE